MNNPLGLSGSVGRLNYLAIIVAVILIVWLLQLLVELSFFKNAEFLAILLVRSVFGLIAIILLLPSTIRRLRSVNWTPVLAIILFIFPLTDLRNYALFNIPLNAVSTYLVYALMAVAILFVFILLVLPPNKKDN